MADKATIHDFDKVLDEIRSEDEDRSQVFTFGGETFRIPSPLDWPDEVLEMQADAAKNPGTVNAVELARGFLGDEQYARFKALGGTAFRFMKVFERLMGGSPGESSAS